MSQLKNELMRLRRSVDWTSFLAIFHGLLLSVVLASFAFAQEAGHSGFDVSQLDRSADPCVDFYQFSCGGWRAKHPLPPDKGRYNRYDEMAESNKNKLREILEAAPQPGTPRDSPARQVGDYYAACIDESAAEKKGTQPLDPYLSKIAALPDKRAAVALMASFDDEGIPTLFGFSSAPDLHQSSMMIAELDQGGLSLPDKDFYLTSDAKAIERRQKFNEHLVRMFGLVGEPTADAKADAKTVLEIETALAKASLDRAARRDPANLDHKMALVEFNRLAPSLYFNEYLQATKPPRFEALNVGVPEFFRQASALVERIPLAQVIGHELTHGFDDEGRKFDGDGNLTEWWTEADAKSFDERASCVAKQYSGYSPVDDGNGKPLYLNGRLTLGENVADNGGLRFAYAAYIKSQQGKESKVVDGFTPKQRVFLGYAISRCENVTPETSRLLIVTDPHSPAKFRLIGPTVNMLEFQIAFACKAGQPMVSENRCRVW